MQAEGIEEFRARIVQLAPFLHDRVRELRNWSDVTRPIARLVSSRAYSGGAYRSGTGRLWSP